MRSEKASDDRGSEKKLRTLKVNASFVSVWKWETFHRTCAQLIQLQKDSFAPHTAGKFHAKDENSIHNERIRTLT